MTSPEHKSTSNPSDTPDTPTPPLSSPLSRWLGREIPDARFYEGPWELVGELPAPVPVAPTVFQRLLGITPCPHYPRADRRRGVGFTFRLSDGREWLETEWQHQHGDNDPDQEPVQRLLHKAWLMQQGKYEPWLKEAG